MYECKHELRWKSSTKKAMKIKKRLDKEELIGFSPPNGWLETCQILYAYIKYDFC